MKNLEMSNCSGLEKTIGGTLTEGEGTVQQGSSLEKPFAAELNQLERGGQL